MWSGSSFADVMEVNIVEEQDQLWSGAELIMLRSRVNYAEEQS